MTLEQHPMTRSEVTAYIESLPVQEVGRIVLERYRRRGPTFTSGEEMADPNDSKLLRAHQAGALPWQQGAWEPCLPNAQRTYKVLDLVAVERARQHALFKNGHLPFDCADPELDLVVKFPVLVEEVGEVAGAMQRRLQSRAQSKLELIQVAAVAVAMVEALEEGQ